MSGLCFIPKELKISKSMRQVLRSDKFNVTYDTML